MRTADVVAHFGSVIKTAAALKCTRTAIYLWGETVPLSRQWEIEVLTNGKLKASPPDRAA